MPLKNILVHVDGTTPSQARFDLAAELARQHGAHLTALFVIDPFPPSLLGASTGGFSDGGVLAGLMQQLEQEAREAAALVQARVEEAFRREGVTGEWRVVTGVPSTTVALHARYVDLAILGQHNPDRVDDLDDTSVIEQTLFTSGRPVLVVPYAGHFKTAGRRALVGWNASRESARAVNDALMLIQAGESVTILTVDAEGDRAHGEVPGADIATHLARHGLTVLTKQTSAAAVSIADVMLNQASDSAADLLVIGAYGHSRVREMILGGVTRSLLQQMTIPVLMSH
ncbi:universal stress protein [Humitalea sp. 24SJ18S-53]|uniref:universal stress protein n=1 Tax=Humitalea sp. 24SJ18S-53 TaxID=3422307 RepID=UPI003D67E0B6